VAPVGLAFNQSDGSTTLTQCAVAIPKLGWRLRVELGQTFHFEDAIIPGTQKSLLDSRRGSC
ncbi:MAG TPA: hypothetical protein VIH58_10455, partial [Chthoniobacterales bacterium]